MVEPWSWREMGGRLHLVLASKGARIALTSGMTGLQTRDPQRGTLRLLTPNDEVGRLIEAAPDHAIIAAAMTSGLARWEPDANELCIGAVRFATCLDTFGVPVMTRGMREAIAKATLAEVANG